MRQLDLRNVNMGENGAIALSQAVAHGHLPNLQQIHLSDNLDIGDRGMSALINALGSRRCLGLRLFSARNTGMGDDASEALLGCLSDGSWPQMKCLKVENRSITGGDWLNNLATVLLAGGGNSLKELSLLVNCSSSVGFHQLATSFCQGACPCIGKLWLGTPLSKASARKGMKDMKESLRGVEIRVEWRCRIGKSQILRL